MRLLEQLKGKALNCGYRLDVEVKPRRFIEQKLFELYLQDGDGQRSSPVFTGIYSAGRRSEGIKGWIDGDYLERLTFPGGGTVDLSESGLDIKVFEALGELIPEGGSLMVAYEMFWGKSRVHMDTAQGLRFGFPPATTPLGYLFFWAGCISFKDWYWPEGGREGPQKLQGFKAPDRAYAERRAREMILELKAFLGKVRGDYLVLEESAKERAKRLLEILAKPGEDTS